MHTLTAPPTPAAESSASPVATLSPAGRLRALDDLLHSLWAHEPDCRFGERHLRLTSLRELSVEVERLAFRQSFHPDEYPDCAALDDCARRTAALAADWSADLWVSTPWPTDLLGERIPGGSS